MSFTCFTIFTVTYIFQGNCNGERHACKYDTILLILIQYHKQSHYNIKYFNRLFDFLFGNAIFDNR